MIVRKETGDLVMADR